MWLNPWFWLAAIALGTSLFVGGYYNGYAHERGRIEREAAQHAEKVASATDPILTDYVSQLQTLADPADSAIAAIVCADNRPRVSSAGSASRKPQTNPADRFAGELRACRANSIQLQALISAVRANNGN